MSVSRQDSARRAEANGAARVELAACVTAGAWGLLLAWVGVVVHGVPWLARSVEAAALSGLALAISAALRQWRDVREPGALAAPVLFGAVLAANPLPQGWSLLAGDPAGGDGRQHMDVGRPSWSPQSPWSPLRVRTPRAAAIAGAD